MSPFSLQSAKSFRQFRVAGFGVMVFLRLAWAFLLALNAFSLTTQTDSTHRGVSIFIFAVNAAAFTLVAAVAFMEAFTSRIAAYTSRVSFEVGWMCSLLILETAGATMFTIMRSSFRCDSIIRINGDATGAIFAVQATLSAQRATNPKEASTCRISNQIVFIGSWVAVGISALYLAYFTILCRKVYKRDPSMWHSQVKKVDWSLSSEPVRLPSPNPEPEKIQRPTNPHLSKDYNNNSVLSLPPVFINPWDIRKESFESSASSKKGIVLDRHQVMAQYQPQPPNFEPDFRPIVLPDIGHRHRSTMSSGGVSALGLEGMDQPAPDYHKSRPSLSISIPKQESSRVIPIGAGEEDYARIGRTMSMAMVASPTSELTAEPSEEPCAAIGRHMSMPFASPATSDESGSSASQSSLGNEVSSSLNAVASHASIVNSTQVSNASRDQVNAYSTNISVQNVNAANGYPAVQHTPKRQSTMVRQDSLSTRRAMRYTHHGPPMSYTYPAATRQSGGLLPLHIQDLPITNAQHQWHSQVAPHSRSRSDGSTVQPSYAPQYPQMVPSHQWSRPQYRQQPAYARDTQRGNVPSFHIPPPPNHSPVMGNRGRASSSQSASHSRFSMQGYNHHSRSSSTPSYHAQSSRQPVAAPMPALLDALRPVLRNSGMYQGSAVPPSSNSRPTSSIRHPVHVDPNAPGPVRSAPQTPSGYERMDVAPASEIDKEKRKSRRSSRLHKSPRNL